MSNKGARNKVLAVGPSAHTRYFFLMRALHTLRNIFPNAKYFISNPSRVEFLIFFCMYKILNIEYPQ